MISDDTVLVKADLFPVVSKETSPIYIWKMTIVEESVKTEMMVRWQLNESENSQSCVVGLIDGELRLTARRVVN